MRTHEGRPAAAGETLVAISLIRLGTDTRAARLFHELRREAAGPPTGDLAALVGRLADGLGLSPAGRATELARIREGAARALQQARAQRIRLLPCSDAGYPPRLLETPDPPVVLWVVGDPDVLSKPAVAVVGSRRATPTGLAAARRLSQQLAEAGLAVVSGLARGIDGAAHRGALEAGGTTVAVLGNGLDVIYPAEHRELMAAVGRAGAAVSEFPPGTPPRPRHFPLRNRIISGLSRAVVVVEASEKSGSLITARAALEQGRDVLAVPGSIASGAYRGCHALIKDGARLVETVEDILQELGWPMAPNGLQAESRNTLFSNGLERFMPPGEPASIDELAVASGRPAADWLAELTLLELSGRVARTAGGAFVRLDGPATYIGTPDTKEKGTGSGHGKGSRGRRVAGEGEDD